MSYALTERVRPTSGKRVGVLDGYTGSDILIWIDHHLTG